jgi:HEAT repeats
MGRGAFVRAKPAALPEEVAAVPQEPALPKDIDELCDAVATWTAEERAADRQAALEALIALGAPDAPVRLVDRLMSRPGGSVPADRDVLRRLAEATAGGMERTTSHLVSMLEAGVDGSRPTTMLMWLAPGSAPPVIDALRDPMRRQHAAVALGYIRDARAAEPLRELMLDGTDPDVRRAAAWALGRIGDRETGRELLAAAAGASPEAAEHETQADEAETGAVTTAEARSLAGPDSIRSLDLDGLAELYEIAVDAWRSAGRAGDEAESERWSVTVQAILTEASVRPATDGAEHGPWQPGFVTRRRERRRARLLAASASYAPRSDDPPPDPLGGN